VRDALAERLLARVMGWAPEDVAHERPDLQALAEYKYDGYQQFSPGMQFVESLAAWLGQFQTIEERRVAYDFIKKRVIFISEAEMRHLVSIAYTDVIRPILLREAASLLSVPEFNIAQIADSPQFKLLRRKSLFLGLSDGAHMDYFRRVSGLSNEQVHVDYRIEPSVADDLAKKLRKAVKGLTGSPKEAKKAAFDLVFLLNDFSGSSNTLLKSEDGRLKGKIPRAMETIAVLQRRQRPVVSRVGTRVFIILYVATERAIANLSQRLNQLKSPHWPSCEVKPVYILPESIRVTPERDPQMCRLLEDYYDASIMDSHLRTGGPDVIYGYAGGALPVILSHNTPNNSVYLLWANSPQTRALFPRVSRHREDL